MHVDGEIFDRRRGALRFLRARTATFARPDVNVSAIASTVSAVVELLACGTDVAVAFGKIREALRAVERTVFAQRTVASTHVRRDPPLHQPLQELAVAIG